MNRIRLSMAALAVLLSCASAQEDTDLMGDMFASLSANQPNPGTLPFAPGDIVPWSQGEAEWMTDTSNQLVMLRTHLQFLLGPNDDVTSLSDGQDEFPADDVWRLVVWDLSYRPLAGSTGQVIHRATNWDIFGAGYNGNNVVFQLTTIPGPEIAVDGMMWIQPNATQQVLEDLSIYFTTTDTAAQNLANTFSPGDNWGRCDVLCLSRDTTAATLTYQVHRVATGQSLLGLSPTAPIPAGLAIDALVLDAAKLKGAISFNQSYQYPNGGPLVPPGDMVQLSADPQTGLFGDPVVVLRTQDLEAIGLPIGSQDIIGARVIDPGGDPNNGVIFQSNVYGGVGRVEPAFVNMWSAVDRATLFVNGQHGVGPHQRAVVSLDNPIEFSARVNYPPWYTSLGFEIMFHTTDFYPNIMTSSHSWVTGGPGGGFQLLNPPNPFVTTIAGTSMGHGQPPYQGTIPANLVNGIFGVAPSSHFRVIYGHYNHQTATAGVNLSAIVSLDWMSPPIPIWGL